MTLDRVVVQWSSFENIVAEAPEGKKTTEDSVTDGE